MSNAIEAVIDRMGAQRQRLRQTLGPRRAEIVQFVVFALVCLPWYMALIRPGLTPWFGFVAAPVFFLGWIGLSLHAPAPNQQIRRDRVVALFAGLCSALGALAFAISVLSHPPAAAEPVWTPPKDAIKTEVTPGR